MKNTNELHVKEIHLQVEPKYKAERNTLNMLSVTYKNVTSFFLLSHACNCLV